MSAKKRQKEKHNETEIKVGGKRQKSQEEVKDQRLLGAHVSMAGGISKAIANARGISASAFAMFTRSSRRWESPAIPAKEIERFKEEAKKNGYEWNCILPHGSYLVNLGSPSAEINEKSAKGFLEELQICERLGLKMLNIHPGSTKNEITVEKCCELIAKNINWALAETNDIIIVLENTAGGGGTIGRSFEELKALIDLIEPRFRHRIGVCLDTCHLFAANYDIRTLDAYLQTMQRFSDIVGFEYLKGMHLNDSKAALGSGVDRHELLGKGKIGLDSFRYIMNDPRMVGIPLILETPGDDVIWAQEIQLLQSFIGTLSLDLPKE